MALSGSFDTVLPTRSRLLSNRSLVTHVHTESTARGLIDAIGNLRGLRGHSLWRMRGIAMMLRVLFLTVILLV